MMKKITVVLAGLLALPAFADITPVYDHNDIVEHFSDMDVDDAVEKNTHASGARTSATRGVRTATSLRTTTRRDSATATPSRGTVARATTTRAATQPTTTTTRGTVSRATTSRSATASGTTTRRAATRTPVSARAGIVQTDTVNTPLYTGRVGMRRASVSARMPAVRASAVSVSSTTTNEEPISATIDTDAIAEATDFCKAQYMACMDNYCNVLDDNQGRCSCSANIKNYEKTENALKEATENLQDVSQKIQYIGLSRDDIEILFTQTEAEMELQATTDNTQLKNDLDKIKKLIVDVKTGNATSTETGVSMDLSGLLDFSIDSTGFDLSTLLGGSTSNTSSISNQRGEQLYKTAAARCKASVLKSCEAQGIDISVITNAYDLEIDKQCILYERNLTDANEQMISTVRNAKSVLQKARLMVAQQKNSLDLRGCITELDACMQNEFVCGDEYENCIDPSGRYVINGELVMGSAPGVSGGDLSEFHNNYESDNHPLYKTWNYGGSGSSADENAWSTSGTIAGYIESKMAALGTKNGKPDAETAIEVLTTPTTDMATYLMSKIGYHEDETNRNQGMCISVLNKCQAYTYTDDLQNSEYVFDNTVIKEYLTRTLATIKNKQDTLLADHAEECVADVQSCLNQNQYDVNSDNKISLAITACKPQIVTCMSVNAIVNIDKEMSDWVLGIMGESDTNTTE